MVRLCYRRVILDANQALLRVSFDDGRTLRQRADFANSKCLGGGLFSWALDLGGPGSLTNPNSLTADDTGMDGANAEGGSDGTGILKKSSTRRQ